MRRLLGRTRVRLALVAAGGLALALVIADAALLASLAYTQRSDVDALLASRIDAVSASVEQTNGAITLAGGEPAVDVASGVAVDIAIVGPAGPLLRTPEHSIPSAALADIAVQARHAGGRVYLDLVDARGVPRRVAAQPLDASTSAPVLVVSRSIGELNATLWRTGVLLALVSLAVLAAGTALEFWLAGRALRPVRRVAALARSFGDGDLRRRVEVAAPDDELGELVDTFNAMLARLEASFDSLRRFTADASHELRAPLALLRSELDVALARERSPAEYRGALGALRAQVEHLARVADQLLVLARADAGALSPRSEPIDVVDLLQETAARWGGAASAAAVRLEVAAQDGASVHAEPALIRRVVDNLVENALRFAPPASVVTLAAEAAGGGWWISVHDRGPGVPPEHRAALFTRFARADSARSREHGGAGLGLALCAAVVAAHGGRIEHVAPGRDPGATFRFYLAS